MDREDYIEERTKIAVRATANKLAPTCLGCPFAKVFISEDRDFEKDAHRLRLNFRCAKMGEAIIKCPDGGDPTRRYAKDIGMWRTLSENQLAFDTSLSYPMMKGTDTARLSRLLKSSEYMSLIGSKIGKEKYQTEERLHVWNEALSFVNRDKEMEPVLWIGGEGHENFGAAINELERFHILEYTRDLDRSSGICEPTTYMKRHLPDHLQRPFGIFVDSKNKTSDKTHEGVDFLGDDLPREIKTYVPEPTQDELYEDWGVFG